MDQALRRNKTIKEEIKFLNLKENDQKKCLLNSFWRCFTTHMQAAKRISATMGVNIRLHKEFQHHSLEEVLMISREYATVAAD